MPFKINWTQNAQVAGGGPKVSGSGTVEADAYDSAELTVPAGGTATAVIQPSGAGGKVTFLLIKSDRYTDLTYQIDAAPTGVNFDAQLLLVGKGALSMVGGAPKTFKFTNAATTDANVQILIASNA